MLTGLHPRAELLRAHGHGIDLPPQPLLRLVERASQFQQPDLPDDQQVHIAVRVQGARGGGAKDTGASEVWLERGQRLAQHVSQPKGFDRNSAQLREDGATLIGPIVDLVPLALAQQDSGLRQRRGLALHGGRSQPHPPRHLPQMPAPLGVGQEQPQHPGATLGEKGLG